MKFLADSKPSLLSSSTNRREKSLSDGDRSRKHVVKNTLGQFVSPCQELGCSSESPDLALRKFYSPQIQGCCHHPRKTALIQQNSSCEDKTKPNKWSKKEQRFHPITPPKSTLLPHSHQFHMGRTHLLLDTFQRTQKGTFFFQTHRH